MPRGVWEDSSIGKRSAATKKAAATRARARRVRQFMETGEPVMSDAERQAARGTATDKVLAGEQISAAIARIRARGTEA